MLARPPRPGSVRAVTTRETKLRLKALARNGNRVRWRAKARNLTRAGGPRWPATGRDWAYVLWDPEVGDFSYDLDDLPAAAAFVSTLTGVGTDEALRYIEEALADDQLRADYASQRRPALLRRRMSVGQRCIWWAIIRIRRPELVVETGVWYGLGSLTILRALELNAHDGAPHGQLISFDFDPTSGWLVPERLRTRWQLVVATTEEKLAPSLDGRTVDLFIHDTPSEYGLERGEFEVALEHVGRDSVLISGNGENTAALSDLCTERGDLAYHHFGFRGRAHWYESNGMSVAMFTAAVAAADPVGDESGT